MNLNFCFKLLGKVLLGVIVFIGFYVFFAFVFSKIIVNKNNISTNEIEIYIKTNGVHTDIVVPIKSQAYDWSNEIKFSNTVSKDSTYRFLAMGWGDKGFYLETPSWSDLKFSVAFKAAFGLSSSAIHATFYKKLDEDENCIKIKMSENDYLKLIDFISKSFKKDKEGYFENIKTTANYGDSDAFYKAKGCYNLFYTCNTWANNALKSSNQKACFWTPFDKGIFSVYRK